MRKQTNKKTLNATLERQGFHIFTKYMKPQVGLLLQKQKTWEEDTQRRPTLMPSGGVLLRHEKSRWRKGTGAMSVQGTMT